MNLMEKKSLTPKNKNKIIELNSFSPRPQVPLMPICSNLFYQKDTIQKFPMNQDQSHFKKKRKLEWTTEEDDNIREFVKKFGTKNWKKLSEIYPGKTPKQYREHYYNALEENIVKKKDFSPEEDEKIYVFVEKNGHKFAKLSKLMPGRTETSIKNRYYYLSKNNFQPLLEPKIKSDVNVQIEPEIQDNASIVDESLFIINDENSMFFKDFFQTKIDQPITQPIEQPINQPIDQQIGNDIDDVKLDSDLQSLFNF